LRAMKNGQVLADWLFRHHPRSGCKGDREGGRAAKVTGRDISKRGRGWCTGEGNLAGGVRRASASMLLV
jgi:hypothetical protein